MSIVHLKQASRHWGKPEFESLLKQDILALDKHLLPLQQGLSYSSYVSDEPISPVILTIQQKHGVIEVKCGIFYTGIIAGCSCADDPSPVDTQNEYCELLLRIRPGDSRSEVRLL